MIPSKRTRLGELCSLVILAVATTSLVAQSPAFNPSKLPVVATIDERFQSYNIEMVEVTGGRFWKPYGSSSTSADAANQSKPSAGTPTGLNADLFQYRPPIDLANRRLRKLATALGPAYVRVSGSWANNVYFHDSDAPPPANAPSGFGAVLTRPEWKSVIYFAHDANADIVTSFAISSGTRDANGVWTTEQAGKILAYTKSTRGHIAAIEFMNEPNLPGFGSAPKGYDAKAYARDLAIFEPFLKQNSPGTLLLGPGSTAEGAHNQPPAIPGILTTEDLMTAIGPAFDIFDYHLYAAVSQRCANRSPERQITAGDALSADWLSRPQAINTFYSNLRDRFEPGTPIWITETADTACGGNPWASTFRDTFRYVVEHAELARAGVKVVMHNTLAASDYGLLDQKTFQPRPNYWGALLWRTLMGTTVMDPQLPKTENVYTYAHCMREHPGGVVLLVVNADQERPYHIELPLAAERYTLSATTLDQTGVKLDGSQLALGNHDEIPQLKGKAIHKGPIGFESKTITFLAIPDANNAACR